MKKRNSKPFGARAAMNRLASGSKIRRDDGVMYKKYKTGAVWAYRPVGGRYKCADNVESFPRTQLRGVKFVEV